MCHFQNISSFSTPLILLKRKPLALFKKKKLKFQPVISNTCTHYLTKHNTKKLPLWVSFEEQFFFSKDVALVTCVWGVVGVYSVCFQCVMVSMLWGLVLLFFFLKQVRSSTDLHLYT